jgi:hypothetical protein
VLDDCDGFVVTAAQVQAAAGDLAAAAIDHGVQVDPAVRGGPHLGHVQVPQLVRAGDAEEPRPTTPPGVGVALQQLVLTHHPLHPLAVKRLAELAAGDGGDHAGAVGRILFRDLDDPGIAGTAPAGASSDRTPVDRPMERLPRHTRDPSGDGQMSSYLA